jgi:hypothetical protein
MVPGGLALLVLVAVQFVPVRRTNPHIPAPLQAPADVAAIVDRSCGDCHSNATRWPWYSHVAPMSWMVLKHVRDGRSNLNFSYWGLLSLTEQRSKAKAIAEQVSIGEMPLSSYLLIHRDARLSAAEAARIRAWFATAEATPGPRPDSLSDTGSPSGDEWDQ